MVIYRVQSCCCGCTLETGTKIIGWLETIVLIGVVIATSTMAQVLAVPDNYPQVNQSDIIFLYGVFVTMAVLCSIKLAMSLLLIFGANAKKPSLLKPWLVFAVFDILLYLVMMILNCVAFSKTDTDNSGITGSVISGLLAIFFRVYFFIVVYSYYKELTDGPASYTGAI